MNVSAFFFFLILSLTFCLELKELQRAYHELVLYVQGIIESRLHPPHSSSPTVTPLPMQQTTSPDFFLNLKAKTRRRWNTNPTPEESSQAQAQREQQAQAKPKRTAVGAVQGTSVCVLHAQLEISDFMGMRQAVDQVGRWWFYINNDGELGGCGLDSAS